MSGTHEDNASSTSDLQPTDAGRGQPSAPDQSIVWTAPDSRGWQPDPSSGDQIQYGQQPAGPQHDPQPAHQYGLPPQQYVQPPQLDERLLYQYQPIPAGQTCQQQTYPPPTYTQQPLGYGLQPAWVPPVPVYPYAPWIRRVGGYLIDFAPALVAQIPFWIGYVMFYIRLIQLSTAPATSSPEEVIDDLTGSALIWMIIGLVLMLAAFGWQWYNRWLIGGRTGQSMGKRVLDTKLVAEVNGQPIGPVNAFLRDLLHVLDGMAYIGYLWPLWDAKRQTFADMIMKTVVVDLRVQPAPDPSGTAAHGQHPQGPA